MKYRARVKTRQEIIDTAIELGYKVSKFIKEGELKFDNGDGYAPVILEKMLSVLGKHVVLTDADTSSKKIGPYRYFCDYSDNKDLVCCYLMDWWLSSIEEITYPIEDPTLKRYFEKLKNDTLLIDILNEMKWKVSREHTIDILYRVIHGPMKFPFMDYDLEEGIMEDLLDLLLEIQ